MAMGAYEVRSKPVSDWFGTQPAAVPGARAGEEGLPGPKSNGRTHFGQAPRKDCAPSARGVDLWIVSRTALFLFAPSPAAALIEPCCVIPENGAGSASLPPNCPVGYTGPSQIVDGLPLGSSIQIAARLHSFSSVVETPGGSLGGMVETWSAVLDLQLTGTGLFVGYSRLVPINVTGETHSAPRVPLTSPQSFPHEMVLLEGQIVADVDFDLLRINGGTGLGMPSPGHTILTAEGFAWAVDSFFDIKHRIDFVGRANGLFGGMSGSTNTTGRFEMCHEGSTLAQPTSWGQLKVTYR